MSRREQIETMLAENPQDTFLRYALAMELGAAEEHEKSLEIHRSLIGDEPPYVPSFFMSGQQLAQIGDNEAAAEVLKKGIVEAEKQGDMHAVGEMREFLGTLE